MEPSEQLSNSKVNMVEFVVKYFASDDNTAFQVFEVEPDFDLSPPEGMHEITKEQYDSFIESAVQDALDNAEARDIERITKKTSAALRLIDLGLTESEAATISGVPESALQAALEES